MCSNQATGQPFRFWEKLEEWGEESEGVLRCSANRRLRQKALHKLPSQVRRRAVPCSAYPDPGLLGARVRTARPCGDAEAGLALME